MKNAMELRTLVQDNALTLGRLNAETLGKDDYKTLSTLYRNALDALTEWASKDYAHTSVKEDADTSFKAVKAILSLFDTEENRIIIDQSSMRTMRDCATKPKRLYSTEYTQAEKARKKQAKIAYERYADLLTIGAPELNENESVEDYVVRVRESKVDTKVNSVDMLEMFVHADAVLTVKTKAVEDVKARGNWTQKRPVATDLNTFADLIENYIADCLFDNYNIKPSATVRKERADALAQARSAK